MFTCLIRKDRQPVKNVSQSAYLRYIVNKPDKFGIKFWLLVEYKYLINGFPYLGKESEKEKDFTWRESVK